MDKLLELAHTEWLSKQDIYRGILYSKYAFYAFVNSTRKCIVINRYS